MSKIVLCAENISKAYFTGRIGSGTLGQDVQHLINKLKRKTATKRNECIADLKNQLWALKDINFEIYQGDIVSLSGPNGAGKSTLLKILSRITAPTTGSITGTGTVNSLLEIGAGFHPELTGAQNIYLNGAILGMRKSEIYKYLEQILEFAGVGTFRDTPVKRYSSGMYTRLAFSTAVHLHTDILIIDETLAVGDASFQLQCLTKLQQMSLIEGKTIIMVSHNLENNKNLCNREIKLHKGRILG